MILSFILLFIPLVLLLISSIFLIIQDLRFNEVELLWICAFGIGALGWFFIFQHASFILFFIICFLGFLFKLFVKRPVIGAADYHICLFISPFYYNSDLPLLLILIGTFGIFTTFATNNKKIAFIPAILGGAFVLKLFKFLHLF